MARFSRRAALAALGSLVVAPRVRAQQPRTINLMAYSGIFQDLYTRAVIEPFMRAHPDIRVNYVPITFSAQMLGQLRAQRAAPQVDVVIMDVAVSKAGGDEGLYTRLTEAMAPNIRDVHEMGRFASAPGVAVTFDNLVLLYDSQTLREEPTSWMVLADPAHRGKVVINAAPNLPGSTLTLILAHAAGANPIEGFERGIEQMLRVAPNVQTWDPRPDAYVPIINGQAVLGVGYNARAQSYSDQSNGRLKAVLPREGSMFQINTINLVASNPGGSAAHAFIDYALGTAAQKAFTELMFYAPTNTKAEIAPAARARTAASAMDRMIPMDWIAYAQIRDRMDEAWRRRVIPASR